MSFHEEVFPIKIAYGAVGGPKFKTTVLTLESGFERRNVDWSSVRSEFDVAYGLKTQSELDEIRRFFYARKGRAYGFRFRDWQDYKLTNQVIGITNGTLSSFQVFKRYQSGPVIYDRPLKKLEADTVQVFADGAPITPNSVNIDTGMVQLTAGQAAEVGSHISVTCQFHVPVRFDTDHLATTIEEFNVFSWGQIPIVEVKI